MSGSVIVDGARTPIGRFGGRFRDVPAVELGAAAIRSALERSRVAPDHVDYVIMGQVLQAGAGQITARQAAIEAGIPREVPAITINKVCLSGLNAIALASLGAWSRCRRRRTSSLPLGGERAWATGRSSTR